MASPLCKEPGCFRRAVGGRARCIRHQRMADKAADPARDPAYRRTRRAMGAETPPHLRICGICGGGPRRYANGLVVPWVVDHIVPRARGGSNDRTNLQWAHHDCNSRKGARKL